MAYHLSMEKKVAVISALVEGCSVRATSRMTGVAKGTILRLLAEVGKACAEYQNRVGIDLCQHLVRFGNHGSDRFGRIPAGRIQKEVRLPNLRGDGHAGGGSRPVS